MQQGSLGSVDFDPPVHADLHGGRIYDADSIATLVDDHCVIDFGPLSVVLAQHAADGYWLAHHRHH